jgi:hypothetical protein
MSPTVVGDRHFALTEGGIVSGCDVVHVVEEQCATSSGRIREPEADRAEAHAEPRIIRATVWRKGMRGIMLVQRSAKQDVVRREPRLAIHLVHDAVRVRPQVAMCGPCVRSMVLTLLP